MKTIHIEDTGAIETIVERVRHEVVLLQLPTVYTLIAAPTREGVEQLNAHKNRLEGKNYGTVLGKAHNFLEHARAGAMPTCFQENDRLEQLQGAFVRAEFTDRCFESPVIRNGTHQSLILDGIHRSLFVEAEKHLQDLVDPTLWGGKKVSTLLCTSANLSGDPLGSIVDKQRAMDFARERRIGLFVNCQADETAQGSYPIFEFSGEKVSIQRDGPGVQRILAKIPKTVQRSVAV